MSVARRNSLAGNPLVMSVDSNPEVRKLIIGYLEKIGCVVQEAENGTQALQKATEIPPKLVLVDCLLADGSGLNFLKSLREVPELANLKVMLVSREVRPSMVAPFVQLGVSDFIVKPFAGAELYSKLNKLFNLWKGAVPDEFTAFQQQWPQGDLDAFDASTVGGAVESASVSPNYVTLPNIAKEEPSAEGDGNTECCLVIDQIPNVAKKFKELAPPSITVESCSSAEEALQVVRNRSFKVILIDLQMKNVDTGMLLRQISLFQSGAALYAMGLKTVATLNEDARALGFDGIVTKPFEAGKISDVIDRHFETRNKISIEENVVTIAGAPQGGPDKMAAFFYKISNDIGKRLELVAEACYNEVVINALELRGNRKNVVDVLVKFKEAAANLGLGLYLVVGADVVTYSKEFVETRNLPLFGSVEEAQEAIQKARGEQG